MDARLYAVTLAGFMLWGAGVTAAPPADASQAAVAACEAEVTDTVHQMRPRDAQQFEFIPAKRLLVPSQNDEGGVRGAGGYRRAAGGTVSFTYSCAFNLKTGKTSGAVFNETTHRSATSTAG